MRLETYRSGKQFAFSINLQAAADGFVLKACGTQYPEDEFRLRTCVFAHIMGKTHGELFFEAPVGRGALRMGAQVVPHDNMIDQRRAARDADVQVVSGQSCWSFIRFTVLDTQVALVDVAEQTL
jgi:hypothetical protein